MNVHRLAVDCLVVRRLGVASPHGSQQTPLLSKSRQPSSGSAFQLWNLTANVSANGSASEGPEGMEQKNDKTLPLPQIPHALP